ncbi:hypothetical protein CCAX7_21040 [Capsulimonas corticalis]|uniref:Uncharacterized protein n=1 Tax=Capsulimonas corticalis TaxID=2219043 RepID=A0A402D1T8_9BACT|nr:diguanylate cyclase [Capsulimonas corticalis]BDI30053.1 hypothetical protein CCAX7_21040 [Capsulimonas corticalis]
MNVLIAEDDGVSAMVLRKALEKREHYVAHAEDGEQAWRLLREQPFDLVISDWMMPAMDGLELCRRIRQRDASEYTYVLMLTAKGLREDRLEGLGAGADDFLIKPLDHAELGARLNTAERVLKMQSDLQLRTQETKEALQMQEAANWRFAELYMGLPVACIAFDIHGRIREWNRASEVLFGASAGQMFERPVWEALHTADCWDDQEALVRGIVAGDCVENDEWIFRHPEHGDRYLTRRLFPLRSIGGEIVGGIGIHQDITQRKHAERQVEEQMQRIHVYATELETRTALLEAANARLQALATTDGLTGIYNHRAFQERLTVEVQRAHRYNTELSLVLLDVDHFKSYNDTFGHPAGDRVLARVAGSLMGSVRVMDFVARYGGEEFAVILPETGGMGARLAAERFRAALTAQPWPKRPVTASYGVGRLQPGMDAAELIASADRALYGAKKAGRDCVVVFGEETAGAASE